MSDIKAIAHITGGGLSNLLRLHDSLGWHIETPLPPHPEFEWLAKSGSVDSKEMHRTFNMGLGIVMVVSKESSEEVCGWLKSKIPGAAIIGNVVEGAYKVTHINPEVVFDHY